jgi:hypothetical protein
MAARDRSPAGAGLEAAGSQPIWFKKSTPHGALSRLTAFWQLLADLLSNSQAQRVW